MPDKPQVAQRATANRDSLPHGVPENGTSLMKLRNFLRTLGLGPGGAALTTPAIAQGGPRRRAHRADRQRVNHRQGGGAALRHVFDFWAAIPASWRATRSCSATSTGRPGNACVRISGRRSTWPTPTPIWGPPAVRGAQPDRAEDHPGGRQTPHRGSRQLQARTRRGATLRFRCHTTPAQRRSAAGLPIKSRRLPSWPARTGDGRRPRRDRVQPYGRLQHPRDWTMPTARMGDSASFQRMHRRLRSEEVHRPGLSPQNLFQGASYPPSVLRSRSPPGAANGLTALLAVQVLAGFTPSKDVSISALPAIKRPIFSA